MARETVNPRDLVIEDGIIQCPDFKHEPDPRGVGYLLLKAMKHFKNNIAQYVIDVDEVDVHGDYLLRCIRTAMKMKSMGITKDHVVCVCSSNHINSSVPYIASILMGAKPTSISPEISIKDAGFLLRLVDPQLIFVDQHGAVLMDGVRESQTWGGTLVSFENDSRWMCFKDFLQPHPEEDEFEAYCPGSISETVFILFSSGTTGLPKGVCLNHYTVLQKMLPNSYYTASNNPCGAAIKSPVFLCYSNLYWISAVYVLLSSLFSGFTRVSGKFQPESFWRVIDKYKVSMTFLNPSQLIDIVRLKKPENIDNSSLKVITTGGAPVTVELLAKVRKMFPGTTVIPSYGCTETCGGLIGFNMRNARDMRLLVAKPESVGLPFIGIWYKIVDPETKQVLGPHQKGELLIKSKAITQKYYNNESYTPLDSDGWFSTGDLVYYDEDYCFYVIDRLKQMIKYKGFQIAPVTIEEIVCQHPAVNDVAVVGIPHAEGDLITAVVVLKDHFSDTPAEDIRKFVDDRVDDMKKLRGGIKFIKELPLTTSGKIRRVLLKELVSSGQI